MNTDTLQRYARAWAEGDLRTMTAMYHDEVVFHYFGTNEFAGSHRGKAACLVAMKSISQRLQRRLVRIVDVLLGEQFGAIIARESFGQGDNAVEVERLLRYRLEADQVIECWVYDEDQRFVDARVAG
jgi:uncharacterized protein